jgi:hypothetical protein
VNGSSGTSYVSCLLLRPASAASLCIDDKCMNVTLVQHASVPGGIRLGSVSCASQLPLLLLLLVCPKCSVAVHYVKKLKCEVSAAEA